MLIGIPFMGRDCAWSVENCCVMVIAHGPSTDQKKKGLKGTTAE
jgi:hypothetical protein